MLKEKVTLLNSVAPPVRRFFNKWRLVLFVFLLVYAVILSLDLGYGVLYWDEMPHLNGGFLLSRGQTHEYVLNGSFYPPLLDIAIAFFFQILGTTVFSGRLVSLFFGVLSLWLVFEFANRFYGPRNALLSSLLLASMPGFIWLCTVALIENMLLFFFCASLLLFFSFMQTKSTKILVLSGVVLGLSFLVKYNALVGGLIMLVSMFLLWRERILTKLRKFSLIVITAIVTILPWVISKYDIYLGGMFYRWLYSVQVGSAAALSYGARFPAPVFYLVEMTYPYSNIHPILLPIYVLALAGLGFWVWRRKHADKFLLIWFFIVYSIFTLVPDRSWRYVTLVFPVLAVSASDLILLIWDRTRDGFRSHKTGLHKKNINKIFGFAFAIFVASSVFYSSWDAYQWNQREYAHIPVREATQYVALRSGSDEGLIVLCPSNHFNLDMAKFYLRTYGRDQMTVQQYPESAIDAYTPIFNVTEVIERSKALKVRYLLLYEYSDLHYFKSDLWYHEALTMLYGTGRFVVETMFGDRPDQIYVISFLPNSTDTSHP